MKQAKGQICGQWSRPSCAHIERSGSAGRSNKKNVTQANKQWSSNETTRKWICRIIATCLVLHPFGEPQTQPPPSAPPPPKMHPLGKTNTDQKLGSIGGGGVFRGLKQFMNLFVPTSSLRLGASAPRAGPQGELGPAG